MVLTEAILEFPGMIERMPGRAAQGKSRRPVKSIAAMRGSLLSRSNRTKSQEQLFAHPGFLLCQTMPVYRSSRWSKCRQMHKICLHQVQSHRQRRTPSLRFDILQRGWNRLQHFIKRRPAGLKQFDTPLDLLFLPGLRVESAEDAWGSIIGHSGSSDTVDDGEISNRGWKGKGHSCLGHYEPVASAASDQLLECGLFFFLRSQPSNPVLHLGKGAAFWSTLNSDSKHLGYLPPPEHAGENSIGLW